MLNGVEQKPPRILVLSASVGAGHLRAAEAVELALRETVPDATVRCLDVLQLTNRTFRRLYGRGYLGLMNRAPHVHGYFYDLFDRPLTPPLPGGGAATGERVPLSPTDRFRIAVERLNLGRFIRLLQAEPWDLVVNTHFLPAEIIASLRRQGRLDVPQVIVTTDFDTHRMWVHAPCEHYFPATEEGAHYLQYWGVPAADGSVTGVPIHPAVPARLEGPGGDALAKHGLSTDRPIVHLQMAGGFGVVGPIEPMHASGSPADGPADRAGDGGRPQLPRLHRTRLEEDPDAAVRCTATTRPVLHALEIDEYMAVADLVVSKPGGLTVAETLAAGGGDGGWCSRCRGRRAATAIICWRMGAAVRAANNLPQLVLKVNALLSDPERLARLRAAGARLARPNAAFDVAAWALQFLNKRRAASGDENRSTSAELKRKRRQADGYFLGSPGIGSVNQVR